MQKKICIFCSPEITYQHIQTVLPVKREALLIQPPASQGDIWRNIREDIGAIVLADCNKTSGQTLWHQELLDALRVHIHICDAGGLDAETAESLSHHGLQRFPTSTEQEPPPKNAQALSRATIEAIRHALHSQAVTEHASCGTFATALSEYRWRKSALNLRPCIVDSQIVRGAEILHHFLKFSIPDALAEIATKMYATFYTLEWARMTQTTCPNDVRQAIFTREEPRLRDAAWLLSNGMVQCEYASLLEQEALLHHLSSSPWQTYVEAWAHKAGILIPKLPANTSAYEWLISKNPSLFGYTWEYEVGLWDWLQRNKRVSDIAAAVLAIRTNQHTHT